MIDTACDAVLARLEPLYQGHRNWPAERAAIARLLAQASAQRSPELRETDRIRRADPAWFSAASMVGYSFYVDRFAGTLSGLIDRLDWLEELGVRLLHPLPMTPGQAGDSDGGFAVADYCAVAPALGTIEQVGELARNLHARGMVLAVDCVLNHCARDHPWAQAALGGDRDRRECFHVIEDKAVVDRWEAALDDVFPETAPGSFTWEPQLDAFVWTSFYPFQWDLNWSNPVVFREMLGVLLFWANLGVDAFRLDSAPFLWKREGTKCRNLPETHQIVSGLRAALDIAAPGVLLIAEAIEQTADVLGYLEPADGGRACQLAYHNGVMAGLWYALARQDVHPVARLVAASALGRRDIAWLTYLRCHDDIIWSALGPLVAPDVLAEMPAFYAGEGTSFAQGARFQMHSAAMPATVGTMASLLGASGPAMVARYRLMMTTLLALPGVPMLYMGDEIALGNAVIDQAFADSRWLHRPWMDWEAAEAAKGDPNSPTARAVFEVTRHLLALRAGLPMLDATAPARVLTDAGGLFLVERGEAAQRLLLAANFAAEARIIPDLRGWETRVPLTGGIPEASFADRIMPAGSAAWFLPREGSGS